MLKFQSPVVPKQRKTRNKNMGKKGLLTCGIDSELKIIMSDTGETIEYKFKQIPGGHGGTDPQMLSRFIKTIEGETPKDSGLYHGLAATLLAEKANQVMESSKIVIINPDEYNI